MNRLSYKGFEAEIDFSVEDRLLVGKLVDIDAVVMFAADNITDLEEELKVAVDSYLEHCEEAGIEAQKPYKGTFNVRVGGDIHRQLARIARNKKVSLNDVVKQACERFIIQTDTPPAESHLKLHIVGTGVEKAEVVQLPHTAGVRNAYEVISVNVLDFQQEKATSTLPRHRGH